MPVTLLVVLLVGIGWIAAGVAVGALCLVAARADREQARALEEARAATGRRRRRFAATG